MLPKPSSQKSQFRTPFRDPSLSSCGFPLSQSQDPLDLLACTPSVTIDCSQISTPGITVDTLQSLIRKSPKQLNGPQTVKNKTDQLKSQTANTQASREITDAKNREANLAGRTCKRKDAGISKNVTHSKSKIHKTASNVTAHHDKSVSTVGKENRVVRQSTEHVTNSSVNPVLGTVTCKSGSSRGQHNDRDTSTNRSKKASSWPAVHKINCRAASSRSILPKNTIVKVPPYRKFNKHVTKNKKTSMHKLLSKHCNQLMPPSDLTIAKTARRGSTPDGIDNVVVVREEEYVYRDPPQDGTVSNTKTSDTYTFTSTSPEKTPVGCPQTVTRKSRNEQVRMDVLSEIYRIEAELDVLRKRRKKIRMRLNNIQVQLEKAQVSVF